MEEPRNQEPLLEYRQVSQQESAARTAGVLLIIWSAVVFTLASIPTTVACAIILSGIRTGPMQTNRTSLAGMALVLVLDVGLAVYLFRRAASLVKTGRLLLRGEPRWLPTEAEAAKMMARLAYTTGGLLAFAGTMVLLSDGLGLRSLLASVPPIALGAAFTLTRRILSRARG